MTLEQQKDGHKIQNKISDSYYAKKNKFEDIIKKRKDVI